MQSIGTYRRGVVACVALAMLSGAAAAQTTTRQPGSATVGRELSAGRRPAIQPPALTRAQSAYIQRSLIPAQRSQLVSMARALVRTPSFDAIRGRWKQFIQTWPAGRPLDVDALIAWVVRQSYLEADRTLKGYAAKVRYFDEQKIRLREELRRARGQRPGAAPARVQPGIAPAGDIRLLEQRLKRAEEQSQEANAAFQNFDQKANQLYNLLASVMKAMKEMAMGTVRNML